MRQDGTEWNETLDGTGRDGATIRDACYKNGTREGVTFRKDGALDIIILDNTC